MNIEIHLIYFNVFVYNLKFYSKNLLNFTLTINALYLPVRPIVTSPVK